ncbi:hypothetical protein [Megavirus chiliensis]|uniref:Uncharacterized protein n=2 Tax=Megavirus chilense TaxID=3060301 RepID=L7Y2V7_9VIRU|nr:hypothetical protein MegaChil _gp0159 [Megavirus chiliensis]AEQ32621.1 hypothetical protein [Megavirus chiliensis]AGD92059.1 hypothetical protein LBA_00139 [Megavirus lba]
MSSSEESCNLKQTLGLIYDKFKSFMCKVNDVILVAADEDATILIGLVSESQEYTCRMSSGAYQSIKINRTSQFNRCKVLNKDL